jgi:hypothetical protein
MRTIPHPSSERTIKIALAIRCPERLTRRETPASAAHLFRNIAPDTSARVAAAEGLTAPGRSTLSIRHPRTRQTI